VSSLTMRENPSHPSSTAGCGGGLGAGPGGPSAHNARASERMMRSSTFPLLVILSVVWLEDASASCDQERGRTPGLTLRLVEPRGINDLLTGSLGEIRQRLWLSWVQRMRGNGGDVVPLSARSATVTFAWGGLARYGTVTLTVTSGEAAIDRAAMEAVVRMRGPMIASTTRYVCEAVFTPVCLGCEAVPRALSFLLKGAAADIRTLAAEVAGRSGITDERVRLGLEQARADAHRGVRDAAEGAVRDLAKCK
jgi:hypothetical protein